MLAAKPPGIWRRSFRIPALPPGAQVKERQRIRQLRPGLVPVEAEGLHHRRVAEAEQEGRPVAVVDVLVEDLDRHREHVLIFPVEPLIPYHRIAGTLHHVIIRAADMATRLRLLTGAQ